MIASCHSSKPRKRLLIEPALTLEKIIDISQARENAEAHAVEMEGENLQSSINSLSFHHRTQLPTSRYRCCGATGHTGQQCRRSRNKTCERCGKVGHFQIMCKTTVKQFQSRPPPKPNPPLPPSQSTHTRLGQHNSNSQRSCHDRSLEHYPPQPKAGQVRAFVSANHDEEREDVNQDNYDDEEYYSFAINKSSADLHEVTINESKINLLIDSGSTLNLIDQADFGKLHPTPKLTNSHIKIFPYNSDIPLPVCGEFQATISSNNNIVTDTIYVINGKSGSILSNSRKPQHTQSRSS